jgi:hypothetical protein
MQHPPGVIALEHARLATEELGVELNALIQIAHGHMDMKTLHEAFLFRGAAAVGRQLRPPQQFSVRNPSRAFIRS